MVVAVEAIGGQLVVHATDQPVDVDAHLGVWCHPDHPVLLDHRQRDEAMRGALGGSERGLVRASDQGAVEAVAPTVIGAAEIFRSGAAAIGNTGAAMPAGIIEGPERAV